MLDASDCRQSDELKAGKSPIHALIKAKNSKAAKGSTATALPSFSKTTPSQAGSIVRDVEPEKPRSSPTGQA